MHRRSTFHSEFLSTTLRRRRAKQRGAAAWRERPFHEADASYRLRAADHQLMCGRVQPSRRSMHASLSKDEADVALSSHLHAMARPMLHGLFVTAAFHCVSHKQKMCSRWWNNQPI
eukprot:953403-Pleurochrysis_carterae.AAC.2